MGKPTKFDVQKFEFAHGHFIQRTRRAVFMITDWSAGPVRAAVDRNHDV